MEPGGDHVVFYLDLMGTKLNHHRCMIPRLQRGDANAGALPPQASGYETIIHAPSGRCRPPAAPGNLLPAVLLRLSRCFI